MALRFHPTSVRMTKINETISTNAKRVWIKRNSYLLPPGGTKSCCNEIYFSFFNIWILVFQDSVFLCSPGIPGPHYVNQAGLDNIETLLLLLSKPWIESMSHQCLTLTFLKTIEIACVQVPGIPLLRVYMNYSLSY